MLGTKMALHAAAPAPYKRKVQSAADGRASKWNQTPHPLFRRLGANLGGETFRDARDNFFENLFFRQILAVIDAGSRRGGLPHFHPLVAAVSFKSVEQREALDEPQSDHGEQAGIRQERDHATQTKSSPFGKRQPFGIPNQRLGNGIEALRWNVFHARKVRNPQAVLPGELIPEVLWVDFDRTQSAENAKSQKAAEGTSCQGPFDRVEYLCHACKHPKAVRTIWQPPCSTGCSRIASPQNLRERGSYPERGKHTVVLRAATRLVGKLHLSLWPPCHNLFPPKSCTTLTSRSVRRPFSTACSCAVILRSSCDETSKCPRRSLLNGTVSQNAIRNFVIFLRAWWITAVTSWPSSIPWWVRTLTRSAFNNLLIFAAPRGQNSRSGSRFSHLFSVAISLYLRSGQKLSGNQTELPLI